jgi:hypothetical protein
MFLIALLILVLAMIVLTVPESAFPKVSASADTLLIGLLLMVTGFYAQKTKEIADKTSQQVEATMASVSEMEEHRYLGSQPWVFPSLITDRGDYARTYPVIFVNFGKGPALDLRPAISSGSADRVVDEWVRRTGPSDSRRTGPRWAFLKVDAQVNWLTAFEGPTKGEKGLILVEYRDIYGREFLSGWEYRIESQIRQTEVLGAHEELILVPGAPIYPTKRVMES